jgi:hypothetical protein
VTGWKKITALTEFNKESKYKFHLRLKKLQLKNLVGSFIRSVPHDERGISVIAGYREFTQ